MLEPFVRDAVIDGLGWSNTEITPVGEDAVRLRLDAPELGRRVPVSVSLRRADQINVLYLRSGRAVEYEEIDGDIVDEGLAELQSRWPDIRVNIRPTQSGSEIRYEATLPFMEALEASPDNRVMQVFGTLLPRLRNCIVQSFHFLNVLLCPSPRVDVRLLDIGQGFGALEWNFVQECGGLESMQCAISELCELMDTNRRDEVLMRAVRFIQEAKAAAEAIVVDDANEDEPADAAIVDAPPEAAAVPGAALADIGLTLEELIAYGP